MVKHMANTVFQRHGMASLSAAVVEHGEAARSRSESFFAKMIGHKPLALISVGCAYYYLDLSFAVFHHPHLPALPRNGFIDRIGRDRGITVREGCHYFDDRRSYVIQIDLLQMITVKIFSEARNYLILITSAA